MDCIRTAYGERLVGEAVLMCGDRTTSSVEVLAILRQLREIFPAEAEIAAAVVVEDSVLRVDAMGQKAVTYAKEIVDSTNHRIRSLSDLERAIQPLRKGTTALISFKEDGFPGATIVARLLNAGKLASADKLHLEAALSKKTWGKKGRILQVKFMSKVDPSLLRLHWRSFERIQVLD